MINNLQIFNNVLNKDWFYYLARQQRKQLLQIFAIAVFGSILLELFTLKQLDFNNLICAVIIIVPALFPFYLWCSGKVLGLPIFPLFALTYLWTYALPILHDDLKRGTYQPDSKLFASITVSIFLVVATIVWFIVVKSYSFKVNSYRTLPETKSNNFLLISIVVALIFNLAVLGGWLSLLTGGTFAIIRGVTTALNTLAIFILSYRWGSNQLSPRQTKLLLILLTLGILINCASLLIVGSLSMFFLMVAGFIIGGKQIPWKLIVISLVFFSLLHYGKGEMRQRYWFNSPTGQTTIQIWQYPSWYAEWFGYSFKYINEVMMNPLSNSGVSNTRSSLWERSDLMSLLLMIQEQTPQQVPYLYGETYKLLPQLIIPRIFNPNKLRTHETTYILAIHYGLQTAQATLTTTIGFGLLNEAYANFGLIGCLGLAVVLATGYGLVTRWSINAPILSFPALCGILIISVTIQTEFSSGVYVSYLSQCFMVLLLVRFLMMKAERRLPDPNYMF